MSELHAFLTDEDECDLAAWLCEEYAARFIVDDERSEFTVLSDPAALCTVLEMECPPCVYVVSERWSVAPLQKKRTTNKYKGEIHYIMQRHGGPAFAWKPGNLLPVQSQSKLVAGSFGDYSSYYIAPGGSTTILRPASMASAFRSTLNWVRRLCMGKRTTIVSTGRAGPWISARVLERVEEGALMLAGSDLVVTK